ncbi:MAG: glycogen synthase GlgA [Syntrophorhabdales bacterium]|jgi:starch synthase
MRVLLASSEVFPFAKTGGLADVAGALPKALQKLGVDVRVIMPKYKGIEEKEFPITYGGLRISCPISQRIVDAEIVESRYNGIPVYLVDKDEYYYRDNLYSTQDGDYIDNAERFIFFSKAILEATKVTGFAPQIIHCNDWETALVPVFLRALYRQDPLLSRIATLLTIHNLGYQGLFWHLDWHLLNLPWEYFTPSSLEFYGKINFLKGGVVFTDVLNTVSKKYSEEIQTPEFGSGLDGILRTRKEDLYGIVNGIDYDDWNPQKDPYIPAAFDADHLDKKGLCKAELQRAFALPVDATIPVVSSISRLADQKGFDLVSEGFEDLVSHNIQYVLLGTGERKYHELFAELARKHPRAFSVKITYDNALAHLIEAGSDMFLMPSQYEPCGLNQLYSLKYGTVPIVRAVGGLDDTISDDPSSPEEQTGFKFHEYSVDAMFAALERALAAYRRPKEWLPLMKRCMAQDFSWEKSAEAYKALYERAVQRHEFR